MPSMKLPAGYKTPAVLCVLHADGHYLLLKRRKPPFAGHYVPVGGKIDPHEPPIDAAIRETREESGIVIAGPRYCGTLVESSPVDYNWIIFVYMAEVRFQEPADCNEGVLEWIQRDNLLSVKTPQTDLHIYDYILRGQPFMFNARYSRQLELLYLREEIEGVELIH